MVRRGDKYLADALTSQSSSVTRRQGDPWSLVSPLLTISQRALPVGDIARAESSLLEVGSELPAVRDHRDLAWVLNGLGQIRLARRELAAAKEYSTEGLRRARE